MSIKLIEAISAGELMQGRGFAPSYPEPLALERAFTRTYRAHQHTSKIDRELACLEVMYPAIFQPLEQGDLLAGRIRMPMVGFSAEPGGLGYYCREADICAALEELTFTNHEREEIEEMLDYWRPRTTQHKTRAAFPPEMKRYMPEDEYWDHPGVAFPLYRMAGATLDYQKLLHLGIPGLKAECLRQANTAEDDQARELYLGMIRALDLLVRALRYYHRQVQAQLEHITDEHEETALSDLASALEALTRRAPESFLEATQLFWLYALMSTTWNYGRMDIYLGPFLAKDLDAGRITEARALAIVQSLWRLLKGYDNMFNNRVFIGGKGRPDEAAADRFAMLAIQATRTVRENQPQLSLRFYNGMNPEVYEAGLKSIGEGRTFPMLYNDDVNIPAVANAFDVTIEEATRYTPFGCGEYVLGSASEGSPNGLINLAKALEVTLRNGYDPLSGKQIGLDLGDTSSFDTFEKLWSAYTKQVEYFTAMLADQQLIEYQVMANDAACLFISMLTDDCIARGKPVFEGGVRYFGGTMETYGNITAADSLTAINELVYKRKQLTFDEIIRACDTNFLDHGDIRRQLLSAPKFGNDHQDADSMAQRLHDHVCRFTREQAERIGLHHYLVVVINNSTNVDLGNHTSASADGRSRGDALSNAVNPFPGMDRNGTTAFLNSLVKLDPTHHAGAVHNMKFASEMFTRHLPKLRAMLDTYFKQGGSQAMISVLSRDDLESALKEPEKWGHLMVRVGGYSARYIDLSPGIQHEILRRTLNE
ncbi:pyruvate formate lyase family protein [Poriferisphaera sp. WC338]|uniref:pyruvate formate lyase family protein n=1 Tax=Poriferisphaera sp. WC338 TaxID=3425129 RepID=UPI003D81A21B